MKKVLYLLILVVYLPIFSVYAADFDRRVEYYSVFSCKYVGKERGDSVMVWVANNRLKKMGECPVKNYESYTTKYLSGLPKSELYSVYKMCKSGEIYRKKK